MCYYERLALKYVCYATFGVTPQPALSCDVHDLVRSRVKSYQDFSIVMNKIVGARLYQI